MYSHQAVLEGILTRIRDRLSWFWSRFDAVASADDALARLS